VTTTPRTVAVTVLRDRLHVVLLAAIGSMAMPHQAEFFECVQGPIYRGGSRGRIGRAAPLNEFTAGDVSIRGGKYRNDEMALRSPAQAASAKAVRDGSPRLGEALDRCHAAEYREPF